MCMCMHVCVCTQSYLTLCDTLDSSLPGSSGISRQECWSGLSFPTPADPPDPGIKPVSLASPPLFSRFFTTTPLGMPTSHGFPFSAFSFMAILLTVQKGEAPLSHPEISLMQFLGMLFK